MKIELTISKQTEDVVCMAHCGKWGQGQCGIMDKQP